MTSSRAESEKKTELVRWMVRHGHYARRVEDKYAVGFPDLVLCPRGLPVFLAEAKIIKNDKFRLRDRQFIELDRIDKSGCVAVPLVIGFGGGGVMCLHPPAKGNIETKDCLIDDNPFQALRRYYDRQQKSGG